MLLPPTVMFQSSYRVTSLDVDERAGTIEIHAVWAGFFAILAALVGIKARSQLKMDRHGIRTQSTGFAGESRTHSPLSQVSTAVFDRSKPLELLGVGFFLILPSMGMLNDPDSAILGMAFLVIAVGTIIAAFVANQRITIGVLNSAGTAQLLKLKAKGETLNRLIRAHALIGRLLEGRTGSPETQSTSGGSENWVDDAFGDEPADDASHLLETVAPAPVDKIPVECPHCGVRLRIKPSLKGRDIECPGCQQSFVP